VTGVLESDTGDLVSIIPGKEDAHDRRNFHDHVSGILHVVDHTMRETIMRPRGLWLAILVCWTFSLQPAFAGRSSYKSTYVITRVLDARTFNLARLGQVRLLGVAPAQQMRFADQAWREAGEYCRANLVGKKVRLETDLQRSDIDGQRLVYLYLEDGTLFNLELIRAGYATAESNALKYLRKFGEAEEEARQNGRGVWSEGPVFKSAGLPAPSSLSTSPRRVVDSPASVTDRQSEKISALEVLQPAPRAAPTTPPPTDNPPQPAVDKPVVGSSPPPGSAAPVASAPASSIAPARSPPVIYPGARLFIEDMDKDLDSLIRAEIVKKKIPLVVVVDPEDADLIMTASASGAMMFGRTDKVVVWASEAGGRSLWWLGLKRDGPRKVAERLTSNLKKAIEQ
jgi:endonuclease YncB( thermonuclease family)